MSIQLVSVAPSDSKALGEQSRAASDFFSGADVLVGQDHADPAKAEALVFAAYERDDMIPYEMADAIVSFWKADKEVWEMFPRSRTFRFFPQSHSAELRNRRLSRYQSAKRRED